VGRLAATPPFSDGSVMSAPVTSHFRRPEVDRSKVNPEILKAAEGMEAMFLDYLMKVMRETVPKNDMDLESPATNIYRSMLDSEVAQKAAHRGGIGLAEQIIAYLQSNRYDLREGSSTKEKP
jgi:flagellar protein FlgJ